MSRISVGVVLIALLGAALRIAAALAAYPWTGDPSFSYCYRGMLIYHGYASGVFLMWHYPGYPCLIAAVMWLSVGWLGPYAAGLLLSAGSSVGLVFVVDGLVKRRVEIPVTRLVIASFLAFYENLVLESSGPLTEPVYLLLIYGALALASAEGVPLWRAFAVGLLLGLSCTIRSEGVGPSAGLLTVLAVTQVRGSSAGGWLRAGLLVAVAAAGILLPFGWILANADYVAYAARAQSASFTFPPVKGLAANLGRALECVYYACTVWLPFTLLLPYWILASLGLFGTLDAPGKRRLTVSLLAIVLPSLCGVTLTIMHKRTGAFLLPAAAIWSGLGVEFLLLRTPLGARRWTWGAVFAAALLLNVGQAGRLVKSLSSLHMPCGPPTYVQGRILKNSGAAPGPVWAFGGEPEVYVAWDQPIVFPLRTLDQGYRSLYRENEGDPEAFVQALRNAGFAYLTFSIRGQAPPDPALPEEQVYGGFVSQPLRGDLVKLIDSAPLCGLNLVDRAPASHGETEVYVFRISRPAP